MKNSFISLFTLFIVACGFQQSPAQGSTMGTQKAYLTVKYVNEDGLGKVHFKLFTKDSTGSKPARFSVVNLFLNEESKWGMMGNITTDSFGEGAVPLHDRFANSSKSMSEYHLIGSAKDDPRLAWVQTAITIKPSRLELTLFQHDSVRYAKATLKERDSSGNWTPVSGLQIGFYVQKYFILLPSVVTDENGEALLEIPAGLKGDETGKTKIVACLDANPKYGTMVATAEENWGVADKRAGLIEKLLSITIFIGIWVFIMYLIVKLFRTSVAQSAKGK